MPSEPPVLRGLATVLADLAFSRGLVLVRGRDYGHIDSLISVSRRDAASGPPEVRESLMAPEFYSTRDPDGKIVVMRVRPGRGAEPYMVEAGSRTPVHVEDWPEHPVELGRVSEQDVFFVPGQTYSWDQLPVGTRKDVEAQRADVEYVYGAEPEDLLYAFRIMEHDELLAELRKRYGPGLEKEMKRRPVADLARSIKRSGLRYPPVIDEGWKRAMAIASLDMDMPFFAVVPPVLPEETMFRPAVEGR